MMIRLFVHVDAETDLEKLWAVAPKAAARISVLLEEWKEIKTFWIVSRNTTSETIGRPIFM